MDRGTDRERLKEVRQTDLTEGRINQDFVDWLKTKGTTWLLVIVLAMFAYAAVVRWQHSRTSYRTEAWVKLAEASLPSSFEEVAQNYQDVGSVAHLARLRLAQQLLQAVQMNKPLDAAAATPDPNSPQPPATLTEDERTRYLNDADAQYQAILAADDQSADMTLIATNALIGRAAVAESRGDLDQARQYYTQAAQRAGDRYPRLAERSRERAETIDQNATPIALPTRSQINNAQLQQPFKPNDPVWTDPYIDELLGMDDAS